MKVLSRRIVNLQRIDSRQSHDGRRRSYTTIDIKPSHARRHDNKYVKEACLGRSSFLEDEQLSCCKANGIAHFSQNVFATANDFGQTQFPNI